MSSNVKVKWYQYFSEKRQKFYKHTANILVNLIETVRLFIKMFCLFLDLLSSDVRT